MPFGRQAGYKHLGRSTSSSVWPDLGRWFISVWTDLLNCKGDDGVVGDDDRVIIMSIKNP